MAFLFPHLWEMFLGKRKPNSPKRPGTVKLWLEQLEELTLLTIYTFIAPATNTDHTWSNVANWRVLHFDMDNGTPSWDTTTAAPGVNDDVWLTAPTVPVPAGAQPLDPVTSVTDSVVDVNFGGWIKSLHIGSTFGSHTLTLNSENLTVTTEADIDSGTVTGTQTLNIGDSSWGGGPPQAYAAVLKWTGGTFAGQNATVYINSLSTANISGTPVKTLDGRVLLSDGTINWTGGGDILLKDSGQFLVDAGTMGRVL